MLYPPTHPSGGAATRASNRTVQKYSTNFPERAFPITSRRRLEYDEYINLLVKTGCIDNGKKIWWDIRLHPFFDTIEFRICDVPMRVDETICLAAIMQALVAKIYKLTDRTSISGRTGAS